MNKNENVQTCDKKTNGKNVHEKDERSGQQNRTENNAKQKKD